MGLIIKILSGKFGPYIVGGLLAALLVTGVGLWKTGYDAGKDRASLECQANKATGYAHTLEQFDESLKQFELDRAELKVINGQLSDRLAQEKEVVLKEIPRIIEAEPVIIEGDCDGSLGYDGTVGVLNDAASAGSSD